MATEIQDHKWLVDILKLISRMSSFFIHNNNSLPVTETNSGAILTELQSKTEPNNDQNVQLKILKDGTLTNVALDTTAPYTNVPIPVAITDITGTTPVNVNITDSTLNVDSIMRDKDKNAFSSTTHGAGQRGLDVEIKNTDYATSIKQSDGSQKTQIVDLDGHIVNVQRIDVATVGNEYAAMTIAMLHGKSTAGDGTWVDVKVNPSGKLLTRDEDVLDSFNPTTKFNIARIDGSADTKYYGFLDKEGNWYIMKEVTSTGIFTYYYSVSTTSFTGASGWSNRALITYVEFNSAF